MCRMLLNISSCSYNPVLNRGQLTPAVCIATACVAAKFAKCSSIQKTQKKLQDARNSLDCQLKFCLSGSFLNDKTGIESQILTLSRKMSSMNTDDLLFGSISEVSGSFSHEEMEMVFPPNLICWVSISASFSTSPVMHGICMATWFKWQGDGKDETKWKKHPNISKSDICYVEMPMQLDTVCVELFLAV